MFISRQINVHSAFEVVAAARLFTETSGDFSDKDELWQRPRNTEEDHRDSVAELKAACR